MAYWVLCNNFSNGLRNQLLTIHHEAVRLIATLNAVAASPSHGPNFAPAITHKMLIGIPMSGSNAINKNNNHPFVFAAQS